MAFFKGRKGMWWAWWMVRAVALIGVMISFVVLLNNFYVNHNTCSWCKYLSCLVSRGPDHGRISAADMRRSPSRTGVISGTSR